MLNIVDISVLVIVIASILFGLFSGFAQSLFSIIRILLSSMLAAKFSFIIINILEKYVFSELIKNYLE